jgi:hypothetical protein
MNSAFPGIRLREAPDSLRVGDRALVRLAPLISVAVIIASTCVTLRAIVTDWPKIIAFWGADHGFYVGVARRWLDTGQFYLSHQLTGPYEAMTAVDTLYPPIALYLFLPFVWLPAFLWWAIPLLVVGWHVIDTRPTLWGWALLSVMMWWPRTEAIVVFGNTALWLAAFVALGLRCGWPVLAVMAKPTFAPFALIGIRRRSWWLGAMLVGGLSIASFPMWLDFIAAIRNNVGPWPGWWYSLPDYIFVAIPVVAWAARTPRHGQAQSDL